jgi:hypothetical protein
VSRPRVLFLVGVCDGRGYLRYTELLNAPQRPSAAAQPVCRTHHRLAQPGLAGRAQLAKGGEGGVPPATGPPGESAGPGEPGETGEPLTADALGTPAEAIAGVDTGKWQATNCPGVSSRI